MRLPVSLLADSQVTDPSRSLGERRGRPGARPGFLMHFLSPGIQTLDTGRRALLKDGLSLLTASAGAVPALRAGEGHRKRLAYSNLGLRKPPVNGLPTAVCSSEGLQSTLLEAWPGSPSAYAHRLKYPRVSRGGFLAGITHLLASRHLIPAEALERAAGVWPVGGPDAAFPSPRSASPTLEGRGRERGDIMVMSCPFPPVPPPRKKFLATRLSKPKNWRHRT